MSIELGGLLVSIVAIGISLIALFRGRKIEEEQQILRRKTTELTEKQLEMLAKQDSASKRASVMVSLERETTARGNSRWQFFLRNKGNASARKVTFDLIDCDYSPLPQSEITEKLPVPVIHTGASVSLAAVITSGTPSSLRAKVSWLNEDNSPEEREFIITH